MASRKPPQTASDSVQSAAPGELEVRLARLGLPARGAQDRQAALPGPLQDLHRALLDAFLTEAGPPDLTVVGRLAAERQLDPQAALAALAAVDLVHIDPPTGRVRVAYPFSGAPTPHRVALADGPTVYAMCALDALGIPPMARRSGRISSADPTSGQPITVEVRDGVWRFQPTATVVLAGTVTIGRHGEVNAMAVTDTNPQPAIRQRKIGPVGTTARIVVGALLLGSVVQGHLARGFHHSAWALGLLGFPAVLVGLQWLRARRTPRRLEATGPVGHALNLAVFFALYLLEPTSDAALIFYGASMWLAALRGYAGCEVLAVSNWLLGRDDQVGCALFWPVDQLEHHRTGRRPA